MRLVGECRKEIKDELIKFLLERKVVEFEFKEGTFKECTYSIVLYPPLAADFLILKHKLTVDLLSHRRSKGWWWRLWN